MKYRRIISLFMAAALLPLSQVQARPHFDGPGMTMAVGIVTNIITEIRVIAYIIRDQSAFTPGPVRVYGPRYYDAPVRYNIMPPGYKTVIAAGVTYFVLNELFYRMHGGVMNKYPHQPPVMSPL